MRKSSIAIIILMLGPMIGAVFGDASQQYLFFDDFLASQYPAQWINPVANSSGNISQAGGFLTLTVSRGVTKINVLGGESGLFANQSAVPIISNTTSDGQLFFMAWKIYPFNMTLASPNIGRIGELQFGLTSQGLFNSGQVTSSLYFDLMVQDFPKNTFMTFYPNEKAAVALAVAGPNPNAANCFDTAIVLGAVICNKSIIQYTGPQQPQFDLNAGHSFFMEMKLYPVTHKSWISFWMDDNAMINVTQSACSCMDANSGSYLPMYPFVHLAYVSCITLAGGAGNTCPLTTQSLASNVDWVLMSNFPVTSLPTGQLLKSPGVPPATLPQPGVTGTITDFLQFEANGIAPGNLYAGGMLLTMIISGTMFAVLFGLSKRWNIPVKGYGLFFTMFVLIMSFFFFWASILPIWIPVMMVVVTIGIAFGVIRTGNASGGLVPD